MLTKNEEHPCKAKAKSGEPCRDAATPGGLCYFHANPDKASELGRIGGRKNRHGAAENVDPLPTLDNALAVQSMVARLITDVYAGKIHPKTAAGLAPLLNVQMRAIEVTNLEGQVASLKKRLAEVSSPQISLSERFRAAMARAEARVAKERTPDQNPGPSSPGV